MFSCMLIYDRCVLIAVSTFLIVFTNDKFYLLIPSIGLVLIAWGLLSGSSLVLKLNIVL